MYKNTVGEFANALWRLELASFYEAENLSIFASARLQAVYGDYGEPAIW